MCIAYILYYDVGGHDRGKYEMFLSILESIEVRGQGDNCECSKQFLEVLLLRNCWEEGRQEEEISMIQGSSQQRYNTSGKDTIQH